MVDICVSVIEALKYVYKLSGIFCSMTILGLGNSLAGKLYALKLRFICNFKFGKQRVRNHGYYWCNSWSNDKLADRVWLLNDHKIL